MTTAVIVGIAPVQAANADTSAPVPIAAFFENPEFSDAALSPSGKYLAVRLSAKGQRQRLAVLTLADNSVANVANFHDADVGRFNWISDERLVFSSADYSVGQGDVWYAPGLFAVNRDGSKFTQLASRSARAFITEGGGNIRNRDMLPWNTYLLGQQGFQDSEFVYVITPKFTQQGVVDSVPLRRLNTLTGRATSYDRPGNTMNWLLDHQGEPRITSTEDKDRTTIHYRDPATGTWRELTSFSTYTGITGFVPIAFGPDGTLYVLTNQGKNTSAIHTYDFERNKVSEQPLVRLDGYDFSGALLFSKDKLLGVRYLNDAMGTRWFDPAMQAMQDKVDAMLPNTINLLSPPGRPDAPWVLVEAYGDKFPKRTLLFNSATQKLSVVGASHPGIDPARMATQEFVHYKARDGLSIPALLTVPQGARKNLPMVVLVHGGPYMRGKEWGWSADSQFLASRGYVVLEPEFRGSTGFGTRHFKAGWKQWGLKMQDDIADGARWAIAQGIVDPQRICIAGASYGGYATLMGLINDPALFKCGINWVGVTDINLLYDGHWNFSSDLPDGWKQYGMPTLIGDQVKDAEQLKATSPLLRATEIKQPLLLAYGGADRRVPLPHGTKFYNAIKASNPAVEWVEYPEEGHGWALPKNRIDFWNRVEKFLDKNIGPQAAH